jgi:hypothetical protein
MPMMFVYARFFSDFDCFLNLDVTPCGKFTRDGEEKRNGMFQVSVLLFTTAVSLKAGEKARIRPRS